MKEASVYIGILLVLLVLFGTLLLLDSTDKISKRLDKIEVLIGVGR